MFREAKREQAVKEDQQQRDKDADKQHRKHPKKSLSNPGNQSEQKQIEKEVFVDPYIFYI